MAKNKNDLSDEDKALWKSATRIITPHKKTDTHRKKRTPKAADATAHSTRAPIAKTAPPAKTWRTHEPLPATLPVAHRASPPAELAPIAADVFANIKKNKRGIDARIDLHGMTQADAHAKVTAFIKRAYHHGHKTVLVITGKGKNSDGVLKKNLDRWLAADASVAKLISGITPAPTALGGAGAFVITLKKQK